MKFTLITLALLGAVSADVSHLNNMYLPPHIAGLSVHKHIEYAQQTQEIPQVAEVTDNSVAEEASATEEEAKINGKLIVESVKYGPAGGLQSQAQVSVATTEDVAASAAPGFDVNEFTQQQASYHTSTSHHQEEEQQKQEPEKQEQPENKYYTGLITPQHLSESAAATVVEEHHAESVAPAAPTSDVYQSSQQQVVYGTQASQQQQEPEQKYYTGLVIPQSQTTTVEEHHSAAVAPGSDVYTQQQTSYYTQQSSEPAPSLGVSASSAVETQYAANGGYVY